MSAAPDNTPVLPIPSRRALLMGSSAAVAGVAALWSNAARTAPEVESLDAELIAICGQFEDLERQVHALYEPDEIDEEQASAALQAIHEQHMAPILNRMGGIHAQTPAGIHARARALTASNPNFDHSFDAKGTVPQRLLAYLMRDAMGLAGAARLGGTPSESTASPDAALIALCAEIDRMEDRIWNLPSATIAEERRRDALLQPLKDAQEAHIDRLCDMTATTLDGFRARARTIAKWAPEMLTRPNDRAEMMVSALLQDLIGEDAA